MVNIILFSQNVKLESVVRLKYKLNENGSIVFLTTHMLYENEVQYLKSKFGECSFIKFSDFMSDKDNAECDKQAYINENKSLDRYISCVKKLKNEIIAKRVKKKYADFNGYICSNDLGIDEEVWKRYGFQKVKCDYYYKEDIISIVKKRISKINIAKRVYHFIKAKTKKNDKFEDIYVAKDGSKKYIFIGRMQRIAYRTNLNWTKSEKEIERIENKQFYSKEECQYLTTLHEHFKLEKTGVLNYDCDVRYIQDGYLPPNDTCAYLLFNSPKVQYYAWDLIGKKLFDAYKLSVEVMPFRKKLYLPQISFNREGIKEILIASSGPGDWTAQKNRSDEDLVLQAFVKIAKMFPKIKFVYRCHPTWIAPDHNGVNSINRAADYIKYSSLNNICISSNIPDGREVVSFNRSSLEEDLKKADFVFGEHSISMIDAGLKGIPFASVNLTKRRNLFCGITDLGFPYCECVEDIEKLIRSYNSREFQDSFNNAVEKYNEMTDRE